MRGKDGFLLWKLSTKSEVFAINCHNIDIDLDGKQGIYHLRYEKYILISYILKLPDCVAAGRRRTFLAFDPRKGTVFWESKSNYLLSNWNVYTPIVLPIDLNDDGVNEIVIAHGGNPGKYLIKFILLYHKFLNISTSCHSVYNKCISLYQGKDIESSKLRRIRG